MTIKQPLLKHLDKEVNSGTSIYRIAGEIGVTQPQLRAFHRRESVGSTPLLEALAKRYGLTLAAKKA